MKKAGGRSRSTDRKGAKGAASVPIQWGEEQRSLFFKISRGWDQQTIDAFKTSSANDSGTKPF